MMNQRNGKLYFRFIDFKQAFDTTWPNRLRFKMHIYRICKKCFSMFSKYEQEKSILKIKSDSLITDGDTSVYKEV